MEVKRHIQMQILQVTKRHELALQATLFILWMYQFAGAHVDRRELHYPQQKQN